MNYCLPIGVKEPEISKPGKKPTQKLEFSQNSAWNLQLFTNSFWSDWLVFILKAIYRKSQLHEFFFFLSLEITLTTTLETKSFLFQHKSTRTVSGCILPEGTMKSNSRMKRPLLGPHFSTSFQQSRSILFLLSVLFLTLLADILLNAPFNPHKFNVCILCSFFWSISLESYFSPSCLHSTCPFQETFPSFHKISFPNLN